MPDRALKGSQLRSATGKSAVLPHPMFPANALIGRDDDLFSASQLLLDTNTRLLTLVGPGGVGKTRLALELAQLMQTHFADGVWFVDLSDVQDAELVPDLIARTMGLHDTRRSGLEALEAGVGDQRVLLVLDNFEHVLEAAGGVGSLIGACRGLRVVVTSREALRLRFEQRFTVEALRATSDRSPEENLRTGEIPPAVELLVARVQSVLPEFELRLENAEVISRLCQRLDGLPLALELVASRANMFSLQSMLERLEAGQGVPTLGSWDAPERHGSLSAAIEWSYMLLESDERAMLRRLAVFEGGWTLEAAQVVTADAPRVNVLDGLSALVDRNLVRVSGESRFSMLRTIRDFGLERLTQSGELDGVRRVHAEYFLKLAQSVLPQLPSGNTKLLLDGLESELENFRAALRWAREGSHFDLGLRLGGALMGLWYSRNYWIEGQRWLDRLLDAAEVSGFEPEMFASAQAWRVTGELALAMGDFSKAHRQLERSLGLFRQLDDGPRAARILLNLGNVTAFQGKTAQAEAFFQEALILARGLEKSEGFIARILGDWGIHYAENGKLEQAESAYQEALELLTILNDQTGIARMTSRLGDLALRKGDVDGAQALLERGLPNLRQWELNPAIADVLEQLAYVACLKGQFERAAELGREGLELCVQIGQRHGVQSALEFLGVLAAASGSPRIAAHLFGSTTVLRRALGMPLEDPFWSSIFERHVSSVREVLGEAVFAACWATGQTWPLERAIQEGLRFEISPHGSPSATRHDGPAAVDRALSPSPRELEILSCVARGLSNKAVARALEISDHTVKFHLNAVFHKLGCRTRAEAVRIAFDRGLIKPTDDSPGAS